jgi:asparagine synthase (glutamine-hydrolysing)
MCGIAGIVGAEGPEVRRVVSTMNVAMAARGPDDMGEWQEGGVCLGHRRLAIIDCSPAGHQPMLLPCGSGTHAITFNGEIYNFLELREELLAAGVALVSRSDTEVLLHLLRGMDAESALCRLAGMFAFGYWNPAKRTLVIARDRLGIKPVYFYLSPGGTLSFASSLSALMENPEIPRRLSGEALEEFLATGIPIAPNTLYESVFELPAGHLLEWRDGVIEIRCYWQPDWEKRFEGTELQAKEELGRILERSVREHLISDVPVGAFLSGGIDSSAVVALASRIADSSFEAFTIRFQDSKYDESPMAAEVARHVDVRHSVISMESMPVDGRFCRFVLRHVGQPFADSSCLPTYLVSSAASRRVKVVLSGDGGDEIFAGYETFAWADKIESSRAVPGLLRKAGVVGLGRWRSERSRQIRKGLAYSLLPREEMLLRLKCIFDPEELAGFAKPYADRPPRLERLRQFLAKGAMYDTVTALTRWHSVFLVADMLRKVDCMSMAASIEVRVPLLDHRLVEFAHSLPVQYKVRSGVRKWLLRELIRPELPASLFQQPKSGFSIPLHKGFTNEFIAEACEMLLDPGSFARSLIREEMLDALCQATRRRERLPQWSIFTTSHLFWMLIQLEIWLRENRVVA